MGGSENLFKSGRYGLIYLVTPYLPALSGSAGKQFYLGCVRVHGFYSLVYGIGFDGVFSRRCEHGVGY